MYIIAGDYEVLRDEITYLAHRAADPARFPLREGLLLTDRQKENAVKFKQGTQVWPNVTPVYNLTSPSGTLPAVRRHVPCVDGIQLYRLSALHQVLGYWGLTLFTGQLCI